MHCLGVSPQYCDYLLEVIYFFPSENKESLKRDYLIMFCLIEGKIFLQAFAKC